MAKKSLIAKQKRPAKFSTRKYNRCQISGRRRAYMNKFGVSRIQFREMGRFPASPMPAGKLRKRLCRPIPWQIF
jgi:small subunit ribosomal protein S14